MDHDRYFYCAAHADYHSESDSLSLSSRVPNPKSSMEIEGILFCLRLRVRFAAAGMDLRRTIGQFSQSLISHWISDVSFAEMILRGAVGRLALTLSPIAARFHCLLRLEFKVADGAALSAGSEAGLETLDGWSKARLED
ncbi:uncharacterized protein LOC127243031 isoform X3 [Andrographis paniculata]|uniref:uncharacterized protein LOC127243031 isoform X3 n=1 Tax=Andrographis paniculata TaxID=175694 RepID=UPI0021E82144|nr:uncharacterized protein LOC127243031 isoform X3 [Andrographis paniculata]XP_051118850.1 uncharacterized protein LOC127243031 isoform X3 [Andrographis paniculata]